VGNPSVRSNSFRRHCTQLLCAAAACLTACGPSGERSADEETGTVGEALVACTSFSTFHLLGGSVPAIPAGEVLGPDATVATGFSPTHVITPNGFIWYTDALTGSFNNGF
jgi:hypothetical protein